MKDSEKNDILLKQWLIMTEDIRKEKLQYQTIEVMEYEHCLMFGDYFEINLN